MPSWYSMVGANTPRERPSVSNSSCVGRSMTLPICVQLTRSRLWKTGMPGKYAKVELTR